MYVCVDIFFPKAINHKYYRNSACFFLDFPSFSCIILMTSAIAADNTFKSWNDFIIERREEEEKKIQLNSKIN